MPWLGGETLYSWCSRYHRLVGGNLSASTSTLLFGHSRMGTRHDVPGHLATLVERTAGSLGTVDYLALRRTVLGYYLRFRTPAEQVRACFRLATGGPHGLKADLGWLATKVGAIHPLKACRACVTEDLHRHGWPTWRLVHQLPAVWICPIHGVLLRAAFVKTGGERRFEYLLPDQVPADGWYFPDIRSARSTEATAWQRVSWTTQRLVDHFPAAPFAHSLVTEALMTRLRINELFRGLHGVSMAAVSRDFARHCERFCGAPESRALVMSVGSAEALWRRLLNREHAPLHPLRYVLAIDWLFESWEDWVQNYEVAKTPRVVDCQREAVASIKLDDGRRWVFLDSMRDAVSVRAAAKSAGVDTQTGLMWAMQAQLPVIHRPKVVNPCLRRLIEDDLRKGCSKQSIAAIHGVSCTTVTRILLSHPAVSEQRDACMAGRRQQTARREVQACIRANPDIGRKALHLAKPAAYAWLYRHDRDWLGGLLDSLAPRRVQTLPRVNWPERDAALARSVATCTPQIATRNGRMSRAAIARAVPALRLNLNHLDRLPATTAAIERLLHPL